MEKLINNGDRLRQRDIEKIRLVAQLKGMTQAEAHRYIIDKYKVR